MTVTVIDPTAALILVDLQGGTLANPALQPVETAVAAAASVLAAFRARGMTVVVATIDGTRAGRNDVGARAMELPEAATVPVLGVQDGDILIVRRTWSTFAGTDLHEQLAALGVTQVVIAGVATTFGVESTARAAFDLGYDVVVVTDAITDMSDAAHEASVTRVFPILGETGTAAEVVGLLQ